MSIFYTIEFILWVLFHHCSLDGTKGQVSADTFLVETDNILHLNSLLELLFCT